MKFYCEEIEKVLIETKSSKEGLSSSEAAKRLEENGKNKLAEAKKDSLIKRFFNQMTDPMIIILLIAAAISGILAVAEGAISKEDAKLSKKEYKAKLANSPYPSVSYEIGKRIEEKTGQEIRVTIPGHTQRGGSPCPYDRVFASRLGSEAAKLILNGEYGFMVGYKNREIVKVPLEEVAGKLKYVSPDASIVKEAKMLGISFGD